jgi:uncharacterized phage protein gp47/JayE
MAFTFPTREQIFSALIGDYASAQPEKNTSRGSDPYRLGRVVSGAIWTLGAKLLYFVKNALPDTAIGSFLDRWGSVYSFPRLDPTGSTGTDCLEVTGDEGADVPEGTELAHADGTTYEVTSVGKVIDSGGSVTVSVAATSTGLATNKFTDEVLTFVSPPDGVDADATLVDDLSGGIDLESDAAYAVRLLAHIGDPPEGGAIHDYVEWAKSIEGVTDAYVWAHRRGRGTIDVAVLGDGTGSDRVPSDAVLDAVTEYIEGVEGGGEGVRPGNVADWQLLTTSTVSQNVTMTIEIDETLYSWDWDDAGVGYDITAHSESNSTITVATAPASVVEGVRIQVRGEEALVTDRTGNVLTLSFEDDHDGAPVDWFTFTVIDNTDEIRASGDLVRPVRDAIIDLFNTLGPARSTWSATYWIDELKISKLYAAATDVEGVDDATISTPSSTTAPTEDEFDDTVYFLVPGNIQVLKP